MSFLSDLTSDHVIKGIIVIVMAILLLVWGLTNADPAQWWYPIITLVLGTYFFKKEPKEEEVKVNSDEV